MRVGPMGPSPLAFSRVALPAATSLRSNPAQKLPPAPVSTATDNDSSASNRLKQSTSSSAVAELTALRALGRLIVTTAIGPTTSYRTFRRRALGALRAVGRLRIHEGISVVGRRHVCLLDHTRARPADQVQERAGLVVRARRPRAAERLLADDRARRLVVDVEVAGRVDQGLRGGADRSAVAREHRSCEPVRAGAVAQ